MSELGFSSVGDSVRVSQSDCRLPGLPDWLAGMTGLTSLNLTGNRLTSLPDWLAGMTGLTSLNLSGNQLTSLPDWFAGMTGLTSLNLINCRLISLPDGLSGMTSLISLELGYNQLTGLPDWLAGMTSLTSLSLSNCQLTGLPGWLAGMTSLNKLDLSGNQLTGLPDWLADMTGLASLTLSGNKLVGLPDWLAGMTGLTSLNLSNCQLTSLPESMAALIGLTSLSLSSNELTDLPDWLAGMTGLTSLNLSNCELSSLPDWLAGMTSLTRLDLNSNYLTSVPESLASLTILTNLNLGGNQLTSLPESLASLTSLTTLNVNNNQLTSLPAAIAGPGSLTSLNLGANQLTSLPESLAAQASLTRLELGGNQLTSLPESLASLTSLTYLNLGGNQLTSLPESLASLTSLTNLNLGDNRLTSLPESFGNLTALNYLNLGNYGSPLIKPWIIMGLPISIRKGLISMEISDSEGNQLSRLPDSIGNLSSLAELDLGNTQLAALPKSFCQLTELNYINLNGLSLSSLPNCLENLTSITDLNLKNNQLTSLPDWLGNLTGLTALELANNQLTSLPDSLGNLTGLTALELANNQLTSLPDSLGNLTGLVHLGVSNNPLRSPLLEIAEDGTAAVKAYLSLLTEREAELWISKLLVVGEGAVGKTSLVKALVDGDYNEKEPTTHGIRITEIELKHPYRSGVVMRLSSWDFGGQDIYHATHQFFLSDRSLFVLLWNARQGWEQAKLPYWLDIIQARAPHARVILVATHAEGRPIDLPLTELKETYPQIVDSVSVDNKTREGVKNLRKRMAIEAVKLPLMGSRWPATWVKGVEAIRACEMQYATPEHLHRRLAAVGVVEPSHQTYLLRALHVLGDILYFDEDEELRDTIILRPQWVNSYIAKVLDSLEVAERHGLLTRSHERDLWSDIDPGLRDRFLQMMEKFDLSYRTADDQTAASLVVERLPWDNPPYQQRWDAILREPNASEIRLRYQLNTLPPGIPTWFIAREHRFTTGTHWRSGALLRFKGDERVFGLIRAERKENIVELAVRGPVPQLFFGVLQDGFESTLSRYQGLDVSRLVPCNCNRGNGTQPGRQCMHLYQYRPLLRRLESGVSEIECELSFEKRNVAGLLFGIAPTTTDQIMAWMGSIDRRLEDFQAQATWAQREFLKSLRRSQTRFEALCPSVFTLIPADGPRHMPGFHQLELHLYCEHPGSFHPLPVPPYTINQPTRWLSAISPYLVNLVTVLKHAAPLAGPVLGLTVDHLTKQLTSEVELMAKLIGQIPDSFTLNSDLGHIQEVDLKSQAKLDADYRAIYTLLHQLDPSNHWAGLNRVLSPEDQILWLCADHARQYNTLRHE